MKKIALVFLAAGLISAQNIPINLNESIELGLKNNTEINITRAELNKASEKKWEITSQMLPKLSLNASYMHLGEIPPFTVSIPGFGQTLNIMEEIPNRYNLGLKIEQPIFTGFRLSSLRNSADHQKSAAEYALEKTIADEKLNISNAFWNYNKTQNIVNLLKKKVEAMQKHLDDTRAFVNNGLATRNDLLRLEVEFSNLKLKLTEAENGNKITRSFFNKTLGKNIFEQTEIVTKTSIDYNLLQTDTDEIKSLASSRYEILMLDQNINASDEYMSAAQADYFPNIFAFGDFYYSRPNQQIFPLTDKFEDTWDVGVGLKWTLWDWGNTSSKVAQARYQKTQLEQTRTDLLDKLKIDIYSKYLELEKEIERYKIITLSIQSAEENLRIMEKKYAAHLITSTELIDAENILLEAETNRANAIADFGIALAEYYTATGKDITGN